MYEAKLLDASKSECSARTDTAGPTDGTSSLAKEGLVLTARTCHVLSICPCDGPWPGSRSLTP